MVKINQLGKERKFKTALHAAIAYLIGMGIIENDSDVATRTGIEKGNLSSFKNGKKPTSNNFIVKFEAAYSIRLIDFDPTTYEPRFSINNKSGTYAVPDDVLGVIGRELAAMQLSLNKLSQVSGARLDPEKEEIGPYEDLPLGQGIGHRKSGPPARRSVKK